MQSRANLAVVDVEPGASPFVVCLLCHTPSSVTPRAVEAGASWRCGVCGQRWDAVRLATNAAYRTWAETLGKRA